MVKSSSQGGTYTYGPDGERIRKDLGGSWTEYISFGCNTIAERNSDGTWTDYIFAAATASRSSITAASVRSITGPTT